MYNKYSNIYIFMTSEEDKGSLSNFNNRRQRNEDYSWICFAKLAFICKAVNRELKPVPIL